MDFNFLEVPHLVGRGSSFGPEEVCIYRQKSKDRFRLVVKLGLNVCLRMGWKAGDRFVGGFATDGQLLAVKPVDGRGYKAHAQPSAEKMTHLAINFGGQYIEHLPGAAVLKKPLVYESRDGMVVIHLFTEKK